jgi:malate synthase
MLSRGADGYRADAAMLDFEDSMKPSWENVVAGAENVAGAAAGTLEAVKRGAAGEVEKRYRLDPDDMPLLMVRVRGLHLVESNVRVDGAPVAAGLFDLALTAVHASRTLLEQGKTPAYYVPKTEHYLEARWWNRAFGIVEERLSLPAGSLRVTFLIETLPAAFQVEEILYELRERAAGLNVGRWDKIFSDIKCLRAHPDRVLADRASIGLDRPWMRAYADQLIRVCHRHGALAIGGMAAFTPGRDSETRQAQTDKVVADKRLEASMGHDGCWVSHPYFIGPALQPFEDALAGRDNQVEFTPVVDERADLLPQGTGPRTMQGLRTNVRVGIAYLKGWREDVGCVAWDNLMEDLATLEISRIQVAQWLRNGVALDDGTAVDDHLVGRVFDEELARILTEVPATEQALYRAAAAEARDVFLEAEPRSFLSTASELAPPAATAIAA